ncbi:MAG: hypothetical protein JY451_00370 [Erythrobacter sp.]|nr:MAG: hypothetical protein JY451_00370 [Erythrobacter sp.]
MKIARLVFAGLTLAGLVACDRSEAPAQKIERVAEQAISGSESESLPQQARGPFAPRDECGELPGGQVFLGELRTAIARRDAEALVALTADDVKLDFGGGAGHALLRERLTDEEYRLWDELAEVVPLGCAPGGQARMTMPWYFEQDTGIDATEALIVTAEEVPLLAAPQADGEVLARLSWDAVAFDYGREPAPNGFTAVDWNDPQADDPVEGFVETNKLRSLLDYRVVALRRNDRWRIVSIIAGD